MPVCRIPLECAKQLDALGIAATPLVLKSLAAHCFQRIKPRAAVWQFAQGMTAEIPADSVPSRVEASLVTWALAQQRDLSWLPALTQSSAIEWRPEQLEILERVNQIRHDAVALIDASTGIGKTDAFASFACQTRSEGHDIIIAVPTVAVGNQWTSTWEVHSPGEQLTKVWGRAQYSSDDEEAEQLQAQALSRAQSSHAIICTHQLLPRLLALKGGSVLFVDEAHLLHAALSGLSGQFAPVSTLGHWFARWCVEQIVSLPEATNAGEIELAGRMRALAVGRLVPKDQQRLDWQASLVTRGDGEPLVWLRHTSSSQEMLADLWAQVARAVLFSGTLGWQKASGQRSVAHQVRRLALPAHRVQDLGRVRAPWRDEGVTVVKPMPKAGADGRQFLGAYRGRQALWWKEVASALGQMSPRHMGMESGNPLKTLVLLTSYADVDGIAAALPPEDRAGFLVTQKGQPMDLQQAHFQSDTCWCWLATGAAWTGMNASVPLHRVVIPKLPLPDPQAMRLLAHPDDAVIDAVARFDQGVGRLVRSRGRSGLEVVILDGRVNDPSARWRNICQPFLAVLGENFEDHAIREFHH